MGPSWKYVRAARKWGEKFVESFILAGQELGKLRETLSAQGARNDLGAGELGWQAGCQDYLGFSYKTAERWIDAALDLAYLRTIADGSAKAIPLEAIKTGKRPHDFEVTGDAIPITQEIEVIAVQRLESVASGDCTPHRSWGAFLGALTGGGEGPRATGRKQPDVGEQLTLSFHALDRHASDFGAAYQRWPREQQARAQSTLSTLLRSLPPELKRQARAWLADKK